MKEDRYIFYVPLNVLSWQKFRKSKKGWIICPFPRNFRNEQFNIGHRKAFKFILSHDLQIEKKAFKFIHSHDLQIERKFQMRECFLLTLDELAYLEI